MTDNIIIQSLTICGFYKNSCNKCPLYKTDICNNISQNAFDLIKRQKEEIEKLNKFKSYEIVRCKDCVHHNNCSVEFAGQFNGDGFCSYGERKADES